MKPSKGLMLGLRSTIRLVNEEPYPDMPLHSYCDMIGEPHFWVFHGWTQWGSHFGTLAKCQRCQMLREIETTEEDSAKLPGLAGHLAIKDPLNNGFIP